MGDEERTLLRLEVDAAAGKAELQQRVVDLQAVAAAEKAAADAAGERARAVNLGFSGGGSGQAMGTGGGGDIDWTGSGSRRAAQAEREFTQVLEERQAAEDGARLTSLQALAASERTATATKVGTDQQKELGQELTRSAIKAEAFTGILDRVAPGMGFLARVTLHAKEALSALASPMGLVLAAATAAAVAIRAVAVAVEEAEQKLKQFMDTQERIRVSAREGERGVAGAAARAGLPVAALGGARTAADRLERGGIDRDTAEQLSPFLVDTTGKDKFSPEEELRAAAAVQAGIAEAPEGNTESRRNAAARRLVKATSGRGIKGKASENAAEQLLNQKVTDLENAASGTDAELEAIVARDTGLSGEELTQRVGLVRRQLKEGPRAARVESTDSGDVLIPQERLDPLVPSIRSRRDAASGQLDSLRQDADLGQILRRIAEAGERTANNTNQPTQVSVNVSGGAAPVPRSGNGTRRQF